MSSDMVHSSTIARGKFEIIIWTLCGIATLFLASRFSVRMSTKGRLMVNDYFLVLALPALYVGVGLLHSTLDMLYLSDVPSLPKQSSAAPRITAAIEMLWIAIYCVKFCFLAQFKFHKPPYAYVSVHLTRYYWACIGICGAAFVFTAIQPILLCPSSGRCRYLQFANTAPWEISVAVISMITDIFVISIPILLIHMANFTRSHTIINASFKSLSLFTIAIAATRLALQYNESAHRIDYATLTLWLMTEAAVALVMASISSYRVVVLDRLMEWRLQKNADPVNSRSHIVRLRSTVPSHKDASQSSDVSLNR